MAAPMGDDALTQVLRKTILALVRRADVDLTSRQFGVLLTVYLTAGPHTVRGLAADLNVSKPAITRALDRLGEVGLIRRKVDPKDRRSVLVQQTQEGSAFLTALRHVMAAAGTEHLTAAA
jgi:DNA-binding MarR family transcriptional regulator